MTQAVNHIEQSEDYLLKKASWKDLFKKYNKDILIECRRNKDLAQEVWIKILIHQDKFTGGNFSYWARTIARNLRINEYRTCHGRSKKTSATRFKEFPMDSNYIAKEFGDQQDDFMDVKIAKDELEYRLKVINQAIKQLHPMERRVVKLRTCKSFKEIAGILKISVNASCANMTRARKHIQLILKQSAA